MLYVSHKGVPGGVIAINMSDRAVEVVVKNGSAHCVERSHIAACRTELFMRTQEVARSKQKSPVKRSLLLLATGRKEIAMQEPKTPLFPNLWASALSSTRAYKRAVSN